MKHKILSTLLCSQPYQPSHAAMTKAPLLKRVLKLARPIPNLAHLQFTKAALAQVPGSPEQAAAFAAANPTPGAAPGQVQQAGLPVAVIPGTGIAVTSVDHKAIQAQAAKVAAALKADSENPNSPYYQAPDETGRAPASVSPASFQAAEARMAAEAPQVLEGGGEAAH